MLRRSVIYGTRSSLDLSSAPGPIEKGYWRSGKADSFDLADDLLHVGGDGIFWLSFRSGPVLRTNCDKLDFGSGCLAPEEVRIYAIGRRFQEAK